MSKALSLFFRGPSKWNDFSLNISDKLGFILYMPLYELYDQLNLQCMVFMQFTGFHLFSRRNPVKNGSN